MILRLSVNMCLWNAFVEKFAYCCLVTRGYNLCAPRRPLVERGSLNYTLSPYRCRHVILNSINYLVNDHPSWLCTVCLIECSLSCWSRASWFYSNTGVIAKMVNSDFVISSIRALADFFWCGKEQTLPVHHSCCKLFLIFFGKCTRLVSLTVFYMDSLHYYSDRTLGMFLGWVCQKTQSDEILYNYTMAFHLQSRLICFVCHI